MRSSSAFFSRKFYLRGLLNTTSIREVTGLINLTARTSMYQLNTKGTYNEECTVFLCLNKYFDMGSAT